MHEQMVGIEDAPHTFSYNGYYKILPAIHEWSSDKTYWCRDTGPNNFVYSSDQNDDWMSVKQLQLWIEQNQHSIRNV